MPSELLNLTAQIVISHVSTTALTPEELLAEIQAVHKVLVFLEQGISVKIPETKPQIIRQRRPRKVKMKESSEAKVIENEEGLQIGDPDYMEFMESREG